MKYMSSSMLRLTLVLLGLQMAACSSLGPQSCRNKIENVPVEEGEFVAVIEEGEDCSVVPGIARFNDTVEYPEQEPVVLTRLAAFGGTGFRFFLAKSDTSVPGIGTYDVADITEAQQWTSKGSKFTAGGLDFSFEDFTSGYSESGTVQVISSEVDYFAGTFKIVVPYFQNDTVATVYGRFKAQRNDNLAWTLFGR